MRRHLHDLVLCVDEDHRHLDVDLVVAVDDAATDEALHRPRRGDCPVDGAVSDHRLVAGVRLAEAAREFCAFPTEETDAYAEQTHTDDAEQVMAHLGPRPAA
jgi:hypothetical protein